jgi:hypothetical protein
MRQAIEEGFIEDVLKNYVSYKTYYKLIKKAEDDWPSVAVDNLRQNICAGGGGTAVQPAQILDLVRPGGMVLL